MAKTKSKKITIEDALVPVDEQPYDIPENWEWICIEKCCAEFFTGKSPKYSKEQTEYPIIGQQANQRYGIDLQYVKYGTREFAEKQEEKYYLQYNDVLLNTLGTGSIGRSGIVKFNKRILTDGHPFVFRTHEYYSADLLYYYLQLNELEIINTANGSTNQRFLSLKTFGKYPIPMPPIEEQQRIVEQIESLFSKLDEVKEKAQCVVDNYDNNRAAILRKAFNGELTEKWRINNNISNSWVKKTIGDVFSVFSGKGFKEKEYSVEGVKLLRISNVTYDNLVWDDVKYLPYEYLDEVPELVLKEDDIVMALNRPITNDKLKISVVDAEESYILYQRVGCLRQKETNNIDFLRYAMQTRDFLGQVEHNLQGSDQPYINIPPLKSLTIRMCDIREQNEVVAVLEAMLPSLLQAKEVADNTLEQVDLIKKSILAKAFRGELGTNDPSEESSIELLKQIIANE